MKYKHYIVTKSGKKRWLAHELLSGLPCTTDYATNAAIFTTNEPLPDDELRWFVDPDQCEEYVVVKIFETKVKDKYKEQLDRIEKKVDALLNAELNKMPTPTPPPFIPTHSCSKCGISFKSPTNYVCTDLNCPTFFKTYSLALDPADRDWEYDGFGNRRRKGEID